MNEFAGAKEFYRVAHVGVVGKAQDIVVSQSRFLFGGKVFRQVCEGVAGRVDRLRAERCSARRDGINACGMVYEVVRERRVFDIVSFSPRVS